MSGSFLQNTVMSGSRICKGMEPTTPLNDGSSCNTTSNATSSNAESQYFDLSIGECWI